MNLKLCVLGSTSAGNSTVVWNDESALLIDCGFSPSYIQESFYNLGISFNKLKGILLTHLHNDHLNLAFLKIAHRNKIPVYVQKKMKGLLENRKDIFRNLITDNLIHAFDGEDFLISNFGIFGFEVPHDVPGGCWGYNISMKNDISTKKITIATDLGYSTENTINRFMNSDLIVIESNHDVTMLENSRRSNWLKDRIKTIGHLSNEQSADLIFEVLEKSEILPKAILLAHISQECNTNYLASTTMMNKLRGTNYKEIKIFATFKNTTSEVITI
ncbi:MAG: MBL fold metallo-hydrolase [bacterium]